MRSSDLPPLGPALAGALLLLFVLQAGYLGFGTTGGPSFAEIRPQELLFWLSHLLLVVPALWLLARSVEPRLGGARGRLDEASGLGGGEARAALGAYAVCLLLAYLAGRWAIVRELPVTDDENAVRFGARMLARGVLRVPVLEPDGAYTQLYTFRRDGLVSSMDFPGALGVRALAELLPGGEALYAALSAATGALVVATADRLAGGRARLLAAALWALSPMAFFLSLTTHAHVPSRAAVALALWGWAGLRTAGGPARGSCVALGAGAGLALLCRPFEAAACLLPLAAGLLRPGPHRAARLGAAAAALAPALLLAGAYNQAVSGVWYLPPRYAPGATGYGGLESLPLTARLAVNTGYSGLMLGQLLATPLALLPVGLGALARGSAPLVASVVAALLLGLGHDNTGIHTVGPIHQSELAPVLIVLAARGFVALHSWASGVDGAPAALRQVTLAWLGSLLVFDAVHALSLRRQAGLQQLPFDILAGAGVGRAVVVAPPPTRLYEAHPDMAADHPWVLSYPNPDPFLRDDLVFVHPRADQMEELHRRFPDRPFVRLSYPRNAPPAVQLLPWPPPPGLSPLGSPLPPGASSASPPGAATARAPGAPDVTPGAPGVDRAR